ncbi:Ubiquitin carboxyl-terminal hydrolase 26 [Takifugu flavidus]|uniref:Ubiquitin carboxyl-terminal hydrolase 26 n=1 Tax=Takifugu flavidus TaxID=433684 RepID=A0A5C6PJ35_9TELE|nr:Ubiquitin carboxyl-terminal hydrolase 26 [Takifugu flavidus]
MQPINSAAGNAAKSKTKKFMNEALRCFLSCFCVTVEDSDEEDDEPLDQPRRREEQAEEPLTTVSRPGSPLGVTRHQSPACPAGEGGEDRCSLDSPCSSTSSSDDEQASLGSTDEDQEMVSSCASDTQQEEQAEEPLTIVSRPGSPLGVAGHQSPACPAGEGGEDTGPLDSPCSSTSSSDIEQASLENKDEEELETLSSEQNSLFMSSLESAEDAAEQPSLGSTDEDPEIYFSCACDTQQEEQAEEPFAIVSRPGSPLGVAGHQSPACPAGEGGEDTCPFDSPCSSTYSSDFEQASLGSTVEEDPEMVSFCVNETHQEEQVEEPLAIVSRPGSPLGVAGHQTLKADAGCDVAAVTTPPRAPGERLMKALNRFGSGRTLTPDELACYGLPNLSQTCYMNSVLQSLLTLVPFVKELNKQSQQWLLHPKALLFKLLSDISNGFSTKNRMQKKSTLFTFLHTIALHHPEFGNDAQQDAHEFLNTVLEQLSSISAEIRSLANERHQSYTCPVEAHISFQMLSTMLCHSCGHKRENMEEILILSVALEDTIMQSIQLHLKEQLLDYKCDCGASQTTAKRSFFTLPNVLIVHLLRIQWSYFGAQKIHRATCLSRELLLSTNQSSEKTKYTLKSIVNHLGSCTTSGPHEVRSQLPRRRSAARTCLHTLLQRRMLACTEGTATSSSWISNNGGWYPRNALKGDSPVDAETTKLHPRQSLGSTDEDQEMVSSCASDTQQEEQAEEPLTIVSRPGSPLGVAGHQSPKCPAGEGGEDTCPLDSPCSSTSISDIEQASLENKDEEELETLSSEQNSSFMSSLESAEDAAEQPISTSSSDEEEENPSSFSKRVSDILASLGSTDEDPDIYFSCACDTHHEEQAEEPLTIVSRPGSPLGVAGHQSLGSTDKDPEMVSSCVSDTQQEEQAEEPLTIVSRPGSPLGVTGHQSLGSTVEEDPEMVSFCINETHPEEQAEELLIIVDRPGSPLGVAGHQTLKADAGCDVAAVTTPPRAPEERLMKALNRFGSGRTLTPDELACYGLPNLSQTCYMNSVLQSLLTLVPFVKELNKQSQQWLSHPKALLFKLLSDISNGFSTKNRMQKKSTLFTFLHTISLDHPEFGNDAQQVIIFLIFKSIIPIFSGLDTLLCLQDAHEFLNTVLEQLSSISAEIRSLANERPKLHLPCGGSHQLPDVEHHAVPQVGTYLETFCSCIGVELV